MTIPKFRIGLFVVGAIFMLVSAKGYSQTIARQCVSSYGSTASVNGRTFSQTVGQAYNTKNKTGVSVTQGFLQPVSYTIEKVSQDTVEELQISIYPNPARYRLILKSSDVMNDALIVVSDIQGKIIYNKKIQSTNEHIINCSSWATGIYLIKIQDDSNRQSIDKLIISN